ncbi:MAG TPA: hypothetical protein VKA84_20525 [Gemmatimonadaceae bacterium]|nr:hypothetical protein [Gemmatimonadaceae bacterium]
MDRVSAEREEPRRPVRPWSRAGRGAVALAAIFAAACSDEAPTEPEACTSGPELSVAVTAGIAPVFSWSPRCRVSELIVEGVGIPTASGPQWDVVTATFGTAEGPANGLLPPITYGSAPDGAREPTPAAQLLPGRDYIVRLAVRSEGLSGSLVGSATVRFTYPFPPD